jgi:hypothetical protein
VLRIHTLRMPLLPTVDLPLCPSQAPPYSTPTHASPSSPPFPSGAPNTYLPHAPPPLRRPPLPLRLHRRMERGRAVRALPLGRHACPQRHRHAGGLCGHGTLSGGDGGRSAAGARAGGGAVACGRGRGGSSSSDFYALGDSPCVFFPRGRCRHAVPGATCPRAHVSEAPKIRCTLPISGGMCSIGPTCLYYHSATVSDDV